MFHQLVIKKKRASLKTSETRAGPELGGVNSLISKRRATGKRKTEEKSIQRRQGGRKAVEGEGGGRDLSIKIARHDVPSAYKVALKYIAAAFDGMASSFSYGG